MLALQAIKCWYNLIVLKKITTIFSSLFLATHLYLWSALPVQAQSAWSGVCIANDVGTGRGDVATIQGIQCIIANILMVAIRLLGLAGFVMLIIGAFRYLLSGGNSKGTETARNTLTFAIVGLVVALSAVIILNIISAFTGIEALTEFRIPGPSIIQNN